MLKKEEKNNEKKREKEIGKLIKKLTLDEKIAMIHGASLFGPVRWSGWAFRQ